MTIALVLTLASLQPARTATPMFLLDSNVNEPTLLYRVDPASGLLTTIGTVSTGPVEMLGLAAVNQNLLYVATYDGSILAVSVEPFSVTDTGCTGPSAIVGLAFSNGVLYATEERTSTLSRIEVSPCKTTRIGTVSVPVDGGDIAQSGSGQWYLWTNSTGGLYRLNVTTAVATAVGATAQGTESGLAFDYQGGNALFASSAPLNAMVPVDPVTGTPGTAAPFVCPDCPTPFHHRLGDLASAPLSQTVPSSQTVATKTLLLKNPDGPTARKIQWSVKVGSPNGNLVNGDPRTNGAALKVQLDATSQCFEMPASGWSPITTIGLKYADPAGANGPVKMARIRKKTPGGVFKLKFIILGKNGAVNVVPPGTQADTNFFIRGGDQYCGSTVNGTIKRNDAKTLKATSPAPGVCNVTACP